MTRRVPVIAAAGPTPRHYAAALARAVRDRKPDDERAARQAMATAKIARTIAVALTHEPIPTPEQRRMLAAMLLEGLSDDDA